MSHMTKHSASASIEVYQYPEDCVFHELKTHFEDEPFCTKCLTSQDQAFSADTKTFTLEFSSEDAAKILASPRQLLDEDDESSAISVRSSIRAVLAVCDKTSINKRMLKRVCKKYGDVEDIKDLDASHYIVTFTNAKDAACVARSGRITISDSLQVEVQLYTQEPGALLPAHIDSDGGETRRGGEAGAIEAASGVNMTNSSRGTATKTSASQPSSPPGKRKAPSLVESQATPRAISSHWTAYKNRKDAFPQQPTHIEVDKFKEKDAKSMHTLLLVHFKKFGFASSAEFKQSYDAAKGLFRFDLDEKDIKALIDSNEPLIDEDETSVLSIRPCYTGKVVLLEVVSNPNKAELGAQDLQARLGEQSRFCMRVTISHVEADGAFLELETFSGASLLVSMGQHTLSNQIVLKASFPPVATSVPAAKSPVLAATASSSSAGESALSHDSTSASSKPVEPQKNVLRKEGSPAPTQKENAIQRESKGRRAVAATSVPAAKSPVPAATASLSASDESVLSHDTTSVSSKRVEQQKKVLHKEGSPAPTLKKNAIQRESKGRRAVAATSVPAAKSPVPAATASLSDESSLSDDATSSSDEEVDQRENVLRKKGSPAPTRKENAIQRESKGRRAVADHALPQKPTFKDDADDTASDDSTSSSVQPADQGVGQKENFQKAQVIVKANHSPSSSAQEELEVEEDDTLPARAFLVSNIIDFDEQTLYFWFRAAFRIWPVTIQVGPSEEQAVIKIPGNSPLTKEKLESVAASRDYLLHGESLQVREISPAISVQVICSSEDGDASVMDLDTVELYFGDPRHTGIKTANSLLRGTSTTYNDNLPVYVITYTSPQDVQCVIRNFPDKIGKYTFNIAEFYPEVDVCGPDSLCTYKDSSLLRVEAPMDAMIHILGVHEDLDMDTLKMLMSDRKRANGGEIRSWKVQGRNIQLVYKESEVAERVYESYTSHGLTFAQKHLKIELDIPWLTDLHDDHKLRISGLPDDVDPEKLKFYLSALSNNTATSVYFDEKQTRAVAMFANPLEYGRLIAMQRSLPLKGYSDFKVSQEIKCTKLLAVGKFSKENIELLLERLLAEKFGREIEVLAEKLADERDIWIITANAEAVQVILKAKHLIPHCQQLVPYSSFLGVRVTSGVHKKSESLHLLITDQMVVEFLLKHPTGNKMVHEHLHSLGMVLTSDGLVTINVAASNANNRRALRNWRFLKSSLNKFIQEKLLSYSTDTLTSQIYDSVSQQLPTLSTGQPVIYTKPTSGGNGNTSNVITLVGERLAVIDIKDQLLAAISRLEAAIQEEKTVTVVQVPNIQEHQIEYLHKSHFFERMTQDHNLKGIHTDFSKQTVCLRGIPSQIHSAQKELLAMQSVITQSRVSMSKKQIFVTVISTESARKAIHQELLLRKLVAVWTLENKTISVYSESAATSQAALDCINHVIWEAKYPVAAAFDEMERQLLSSEQWQDKKENMQSTFHPLMIKELTDSSRVVMVGLNHHKAIVLEELPMFFKTHVQCTETAKWNPCRLAFLCSFQPDVLAQLKKTHNVTITKAEENSVIISGVRDDIANCKRALAYVLEDICKDTHNVEHHSMIQHIKENPEFLKQAGQHSRCLVVYHSEESRENSSPSLQEKSNNKVLYSVTLPTSGATCVVKMADITEISVDAIVNAANSDLQHVGGLALAIVRQGGQGIQQECCHHTRKNGPLMEGQVFTSSAGNLRCKKIIHAVGPRWNQGRSGEEHVLYACIENCLEEAKKHNLQSIAIPPISTGIFGFPLDKAVRTIVEAVHNSDKKGSLPGNVIFVDTKEDSLKLFEKELTTKYKTSKHHPRVSKNPQGKQKQSTASAAQTDYTVNGRVITVANRVTIEIIHGDILSSQVDCLVNSVGPNMDLSAGQVSKIIAARAGPHLQAVCFSMAPLKPGDVVDTQAFNFPCHKILHCVCPHWENKKTLNRLKIIVEECLKLAAKDNYRSIAFPTLGAGNLEYPEYKVAKSMIEAILDYTKAKPASSITDVKIVIYHRDQTTQQAFDSELQILGETAQLSRDLLPKGTAQESKDAPKMCVRFHKTTVRLLPGDLTAHPADVLVNSTDAAMNMGGQVSHALLLKAGFDVQQEVAGLSNISPSDGIWISCAGDLPANYIFHIDGASVGWEQIVYNCLSTSEVYNQQSIAFPFLGTDTSGVRREKPGPMAETMLKAICRYIDAHMQTKLTRIDIVILRADVLNDFHVSMKKWLQPSNSLVTKLKTKVTDMFSSLILGGPASTEEVVSVRRKVKFDPTQLAPGEASLKLDIYGRTPEDIASCKKELETKIDKAIDTVMWSTKPSYEDDRDNIPELSLSQIERLKIKSVELRVSLEIDQVLCNIKITGLSQDVISMCDYVTLELKAIEKRIQEQREEALVARTVQWLFEDVGGAWDKFHPTTNKALEETYIANPTGRYSYDGNNGQVTLYLDKMVGVERGSQFNIRRKDLNKPQGAMGLPSTWQAPVDIYSEFKLAPNTQEYQDVEDIFMKTLGAGGNVLIEATRVQNPTLYLQYAILRKAAATRLGVTENLVEKHLWHGTDEATVKKITSGKFDRSLSGKNALMYGAGSYFATTSAYSARYAAVNRQGEKYMILTQVITGEWCQGNQQLQAAPYKQNSIEQYDSVVDDVINPTIFVVFNDASAYPCYILKFQ